MATSTLVLVLDADDARAVRAAIARRKGWPLPEGGGNLNGQVVAEICRGWMEMLDAVRESPRGAEGRT